MSNSSIYEKIEEKGRNDVLSIQKQSIEKAEILEKEILQEAHKRIKKILDENDARNADIINNQITEIEQFAKQQSLACKKEIISEVFKNVHHQLLNLKDDEFVNLVVKMVKSSDIKGNEVIKVSKNEYAKYQRLFSSNNSSELDKLNTKLGSKYHLSLDLEFADINGGFIIVGEHYDIDNSYTTILNDLSAQMETEIANLLFNE